MMYNIVYYIGRNFQECVQFGSVQPPVDYSMKYYCSLGDCLGDKDPKNAFGTSEI